MIESAYFVTKIQRFECEKDLLTVKGRAIKITAENQDELIEKYGVTPYSINDSYSEAFSIEGEEVERAYLCQGSVEKPKLFNVVTEKNVFWLAEPWLKDSSVSFSAVFETVGHHAKTCDMEIIEDKLCRRDFITKGDILRMSGIE
jgi:hypothetical protein